MARSRRRVVQTVALGPRAFNDGSDSHDPLDLTLGGATGFLATDSQAVPPGAIRRLLALDERSSDALLSRYIWRGYGGDSPHASPQSSRRPWPSARASALVRGTRLPSPTLKAQQIRALDWREFRRLKVRNPSRVDFCVRRHVRRSVLFALGVGGHKRRSPGAGGRYRRLSSSAWRC